MASKPCTDCGVEAKRPGSPRYCAECWLDRQDIDTRTAYVRRRLAAVPEGLRRSRVPEREWPPGRRWCSGCQSMVRLRDCGGSRCRTCASIAAHGSRLASTYTLGGRPFTVEDYEALMRAQGGRCFVCRRRAGARRFAVDHDHRTGEVRGLLCSDPEWGCNLKVLARFDADDDPLAMARRLVQYLEAPPAQRLIRSS